MKEFFFESENIEEIKHAIINLSKSWEPIVIRKKNSIFSRDEWKIFLSESCSLKLDRRHYGFSEGLEPSDWWEISYQPPKSTSYAYSNTRQPLHTDNAWFSDPAEIVFFIMEKQAITGGEQSIYPLERLIDDLESEASGLFKDLISTEVVIRKGSGEHYNQTPIIQLSDGGRISWNYYRTEKTTPHINRMCDEFFKFLEMKEQSSSVEYLKCNTGDSFCFNDLKMLHGRSAYEAKLPFDRILLQSMWKI